MVGKKLSDKEKSKPKPHKKKHKAMMIMQKYILLTMGALLAAVALELILIPNRIIDGGVVGISIMVSYLSGLPLGLFTFILNVPFLYIGYRQIGKNFVISSFYGMTALSIFVTLLNHGPEFTDDVLLATVFGGIILGVGVGLIIRFGGSLDGTEMIAIMIDRKSSFSVGQIVMFFNLFILSSAGLVFGWDRAMYSLITYFIAFKVIDITIKGLDEVKAAIIVTENGDVIAQTILARLGRTVTFFEGKSHTTGQKDIIYSVVTRLEIAKLKEIVNAKDEEAFVTIMDVSDIIGSAYKKKAIH